MIRRVAFGKAIMAGAIGALAWEAVVRVLILLGLPLFDLVFILGTMMTADVRPLIWWPIGMTMHATVGAIWAIFYAYFSGSHSTCNQLHKASSFSLGPAVLAGLSMVPQMSFMHALILESKLPATFVFSVPLWLLGMLYTTTTEAQRTQRLHREEARIRTRLKSPFLHLHSHRKSATLCARALGRLNSPNVFSLSPCKSHCFS